MSKYADEMERSLNNTRRIRELTKDLIKDGSDLALKEYYKAKSFERLKGKIVS